ncbi:MAG: tetratricopeptide repeat protein [Parachlamydiales bacterium]|nr:tetratricopeptide repeat protein [Parachlamydiales bacterium]
MFIRKFLITFILLLTVLFKINADESTASVHEHYNFAAKSFEKQDWMSVINHSMFIIKKFPDSSFSKEALYFLGVAYFNVRDFELSNRYLTRYLKDDISPKYFEEAMHYKFAIAEKYKEGSRKRAFGWKKGPKILEADEDALAIYDEVIATLPSHEIAAKAMYSKAQIQKSFHEYDESVETLKEVIKRFSKSDIAIDSFIEIGNIYKKQTTVKQQNQDILDLAEINLANLKQAFPDENERILELQTIVSEMHETFSNGLYEIASFYEKTKKAKAATIYYTKILNSFPNTKKALLAKQRLNLLEKTLEKSS